jgi:hypothetical protein
LASQSNVPALVIDATGVTIPQAGEIQAGVLSDINAAFGGNLDITTVGTPQDDLSEDITEYIQAANGAIADTVSQVDPNNAEGRMQDAIGRIYFLTRIAATASVVTGTCTGAPNTILPAGSTAVDTVPGQGFTWVTLAAATFNSGGQCTPQFACTTYGPVQLPIGALTQIAAVQSGVQWDAVTNLSAASLGSNVENQADFEFRRRNSVAANAQGSPAAIYGAVLGVAGVTDCYVIENPKGTVVNTGSTNYPLAANSVYVAAVGGTAQSICDAIWTKKDLGCNYNGNTSATVIDTSSEANPQPSYTVTYEQPNALSIQFAIQIKNSSSLPSNIVSLVQQAIVSAFAGGDGGPRARIASTLFASRFIAPIVNVGPSVVNVISCLLGSDGGGATNNSVAVGIDQYPTLATSDISVTLV